MTVLAGPRGACRSCGAVIVWTFTPKGRRMPLDPESVSDGNVIVTGHIQGGKDHGTPTVTVLRAGELPLQPGEPLYVSHFSTCPQAAQHRRKR